MAWPGHEKGLSVGVIVIRDRKVQRPKDFRVSVIL